VRILHISPQNYTGVLTLFVRGHRSLGHHSNLVTFYRSRNLYNEDICLNLPFVGHREWLWTLKRLVKSGSMRVPFTGTTERIFWTPSRIERVLMAFRDLVWTPVLARARRKHGLDNFDIYHLEGGMSFFRDGRDVKRLKSMGRKIVSNYHGLDLRMRGAIRPVWDATDLHTTCEFDLFLRFPEIEYLFLPFDPDLVPPALPGTDRIRICHAPRIRSVKGTEQVIGTVERLSSTHPVDLVLIENVPHATAMAMKAGCQISIDQVADGDMGYGVNSLESLSMGICTVTNLSAAYEEFIPDHPFFTVTPGNLERRLKELLEDRELRLRHAAAGPSWIRKRHHWKTVAEHLHKRYRELGWSVEG